MEEEVHKAIVEVEARIKGRIKQMGAMWSRSPGFIGKEADNDSAVKAERCRSTLDATPVGGGGVVRTHTS